MAEAHELNGTVERLLPGGEAVVRCGGGVMLVANGVPGDELELIETDRRRGVRRGVIGAIVKASHQRVNAPCSVAGDCGGCALQYLDLVAHASLKSQWVAQAFAAFRSETTEWLPISGVPVVGQRRRARWHRGEDAQGSFLGFRARGSHTVVRNSSCMVVEPRMDALRLRIEGVVPRQVEAVRMTLLHDGMHLVLESKVLQAEQGSVLCGAILEELADEVDVQPWWQGTDGLRPLRRPVRPLHDRLPSGEMWVDLSVGPDDFIQGQAQGNLQMVRQLQAWAGKPRRVVDMFCGIGNLSLPLAAASSAVVRGADMAVSGIRQAHFNAEKLGIAAHFETVNLFSSAYRAGEDAGADVLILDAPRKGAKAICRQMSRLLPGMIIMVNCDIAAGARDAGLLAEQGYRLRALRAFDLFPFSGHVEAMSCWTQ